MHSLKTFTLAREMQMSCFDDPIFLYVIFFLPIVWNEQPWRKVSKSCKVSFYGDRRWFPIHYTLYTTFGVHCDQPPPPAAPHHHQRSQSFALYFCSTCLLVTCMYLSDIRLPMNEQDEWLCMLLLHILLLFFMASFYCNSRKLSTT